MTAGAVVHDLDRLIGYCLAGMALPLDVARDDLEQAGRIGYWKAERGFDSERGASFVTYARRRIRGEILDELRRQDWRGIRVQNIHLERCRLTDELLATLPGSEEDPADVVFRLELAPRVRTALATLPSREREIIEAYYFDDEMLESVAQRWGVTGSAVTQLHRKALRRLRFRVAV